MKDTRTRFWFAVVALGLVGGLASPAARQSAPSAPQKTTPEKAPSVAGKWQIEADTPHGKLVLGFDLTVDAKDSKKLTGTLSSDQMGDMPLTGEFVDGKLSLAVKSEFGDLAFVAKFKDADTLTGILSSHLGDLSCLAIRVKK